MRNNLSRWVILLWSAALLVAAGILTLLFISPRPSPPSSPRPTTLEIIPTTTPSASQPPPTRTPIPSATIPLSPTPVFSQRQIIGFSVDYRPLEVYQFGDGSIEKMIVAGIHGGYEWNTIILADELIEYINTHQEIIPDDHTLFILRAFNPDGFERSRGFGGRANDNNVDLNRNFPSNWQREWPREGCWDYIPITGGSGPASEPETQALIKFIEEHKLHALISYHSAALGIFPGGQPPDQASLDLAKSISEVSNYPYPPIDAGCTFTGQLIDWTSDQGIPSVDIELTNHQDSDFEINLAILSVFLDWTPPK